MASLKLRAIGNSVGVVLPKELLARLKVGEGDTVQLIEAPDGFILRAQDAEVDEQLALGRELMKRYRDTFRILSK